MDAHLDNASFFCPFGTNTLTRVDCLVQETFLSTQRFFQLHSLD